MAAALSSTQPDGPQLTKAKSFTFSPAFDHGVSGFLAGAVATAVLHPLDLVKTRFKRGGFGVRATWNSLVAIRSLDGVAGLYRGISANMAGATLSWGLYFWWYSLIKEDMTARNKLETLEGPAKKLSASEHLMASAAAGAITALFTNPFWLVKTRMCADRASDPGAYKSLTEGLRVTYRNEGIAGLYKGIGPALFGVSHGALQFMAYEEMKKVWGAQMTGTGEYLVMAALSKIFATVCTYPYQVVRARLQNERTRKNVVYKGAIGTMQRIYTLEGFSGFYKGLGPNVIRVMPGTMLTFGVYEV
ncbi:mitochondrial carrier domain-containing protein [Chytridium lagenaria]|nr:mitochondrial carrier domain-containing protein [Chytridium lagenaria]